MLRKLLTVIALCCTVAAAAQQNDPARDSAEVRRKAADFARFQQYFDSLLHYDWAWLSRYAGDNKSLPAPAAGEKRVVFMGNSITEGWRNQDPAFFTDHHYVCRGIGGQVSAQMLVRFREDVIHLKPVAVVIEAGTNDLAENRGHVPIAQIFGNIVSMVELARANHIIPIIGAVLPATEFPWHRGLQPAGKIVALNKLLADYAKANHLVYIDYWTALVNDEKGMKVGLAEDKLVHPNLAGYKVMEPLAKAAIDKALARQ